MRRPPLSQTAIVFGSFLFTPVIVFKHYFSTQIYVIDSKESQQLARQRYQFECTSLLLRWASTCRVSGPRHTQECMSTHVSSTNRCFRLDCVHEVACPWLWLQDPHSALGGSQGDVLATEQTSILEPDPELPEESEPELARAPGDCCTSSSSKEIMSLKEKSIGKTGGGRPMEANFDCSR